MTRPLDPPQWATDTNYPAGGETWSGTQTKVAPINRNVGFTPRDRPAAQTLNYDHNLIGQWLEYLAHIQVLNWPRYTSIGAVVANGNRANCLAHTTLPSVVMLGGVAAAANFKLSLDGGQTWLNAGRTNDNTNMTINCVANNGQTLIAAGPSAGTSTGSQNIYRSTNGGADWVGNILLPSASTGTAFSIQHVHRAATVFCAGGQDHAGVAYMATSSDGSGGSWTQRTVAGGTGVRSVLRIVSGLAAGAPRIVAFGVSDSAGTPSALGWRSDDAGVTWSAFTPPAGLCVAAAYSTELGLWMAICLSGVGPNATVHTSVDGINWGASLFTLSNAGVGVGGNQLTVSGSLWVVAVPTAQANFASLIYWSTNAGVSWRAARIGSVDRAVRSVLFAPQTQVGFHGGISLGEAFVSGSDWTTDYRQSLRLGAPAIL